MVPGQEEEDVRGGGEEDEEAAGDGCRDDAESPDAATFAPAPGDHGVWSPLIIG